MPQPFSAKLGFVLKALSMSRGQLAAELNVDKSIVGRWVTGAVQPSVYNLSRLTAWMAGRVGGFNSLDWERDLDSLAGRLGVEPQPMVGASTSALGGGLLLPLLDEVRAMTAKRGGAYEGFFRSTRPYAQAPGRFLHDTMMIRKDESGLLRLDMATNGVSVKGWVLLLHNHLFVVGAELTSGSFAFGIFNGVNTVQAGVLDGLILNSSLDAGLTPTAVAAVVERVGEITGDTADDDLRFAEMAKAEALAPEGSVPEAIKAHLARDIGPAALAMGGDWLLRMPLARTVSAGLPVV